MTRQISNSFTYLIIILILSLTYGCSINKSIRSRELLEKCDFSIKTIEIKQRGGSNNLLGLLNQFASGTTPTIDVNVLVSVNNPNEERVIVDSLSLNVIVKDDSLSRIKVNQYTEIEPKSTKDVPVALSLPITPQLLQAANAKKYTLKGTVWMKIELFEGFETVYAYPLEIEKKM